MRPHNIVGLLLAVAVGAVAQQDEGPVLKPKAHPGKPASATLIILCDLACNWKLDGEAKSGLAEGGSTKIVVTLGQHLVDAATQDGLDKVQQEIQIKSPVQTIMHIELRPLRDARLKADRVKEGRVLVGQKRYLEAKPIFEKACEGGSMVGCTALGELYNNGYPGVARDFPKARSLYQKACESGAGDACTNLGWMWENGQGLAKSPEKARLFYERACSGGFMLGCTHLAQISDDRQKARVLYQEACDGGEGKACDHLGNSCCFRFGGTRDYKQARPWFEKACNLGSSDGCGDLAFLYETGKGVSKDTTHARVLYSKACLAGNEISCSRLRSLQ
jgi:Sel1 repeat